MRLGGARLISGHYANLGASVFYTDPREETNPVFGTDAQGMDTLLNRTLFCYINPPELNKIGSFLQSTALHPPVERVAKMLHSV